MNLEKKKILAAKTLGVGKGRIVLNTSRLEEVKEAITKQDIRDLHQSGAIGIKEVSGRKTVVKRKTRRRVGSIKKNVNTRKKDYMALVRKLRAHLRGAVRQGHIDREQNVKLRKQTKAKTFRSLSHLKEHMAQEAEK
jgi:large subunit ribosomal protein L19e